MCMRYPVNPDRAQPPATPDRRPCHQSLSRETLRKLLFAALMLDVGRSSPDTRLSAPVSVFLFVPVDRAGSTALQSLVTHAGHYETSFLIENKRDRVQCFIGLVKVFSLPEQTGNTVLL